MINWIIQGRTIFGPMFWIIFTPLIAILSIIIFALYDKFAKRGKDE